MAMANHFSTLGITVQSEDAFNELIYQTATSGTVIATPPGLYICWAMGGGVELWAQATHERRLLGLNPHFSGPARMRVGITNRVERASDTELDGALHGWADPAGDDPESGSYPFVVDVPDIHTLGELALPAIHTIQIAAFAHTLSVFADEEEYRRAPQDEPRFATESFIPVGLFETSGEPPAHAMFTGRVLEAALRTNPATGAPFFWALVRTLGGQIDVVADPALVQAPLVAGGVVQGMFWLSGRVI
jgi:hypothetical protein